MADVTQTEPGLRTPRMVMHVWTASITTANALGVKLFDQQVGDLLGHALLDLRTPGDLLDHPRQLAQTDHAVARQVRDVRPCP